MDLRRWIIVERVLIIFGTFFTTWGLMKISWIVRWVLTHTLSLNPGWEGEWMGRWVLYLVAGWAVVTIGELCRWGNELDTMDIIQARKPQWGAIKTSVAWVGLLSARIIIWPMLVGAYMKGFFGGFWSWVRISIRGMRRRGFRMRRKWDWVEISLMVIAYFILTLASAEFVELVGRGVTWLAGSTPEEIEAHRFRARVWVGVGGALITLLEIFCWFEEDTFFSSLDRNMKDTPSFLVITTWGVVGMGMIIMFPVAIAAWILTSMVMAYRSEMKGGDCLR